ncbi:hypothetical protein CROQUDRAFT_652686 [Cronartium quercuum f. sp. fusiforme G11]|uniref:SET domain-containing protein n=1 Tax=Cronartium quercuum f. sp. fusiforme G11 TaxID=708437 RepID=A0A9P6NN77_9BASI|nr:hypothetical protein CROQUDRAFT_652686 [Cronartium quercuum f. sp. fusiforme G11]
MCGISVILKRSPKAVAMPSSGNPSDHSLDLVSECVRRAIGPRGPDVQSEARVEISDSSPAHNLNIQFFGSVLHMRGPSVTVQPIRAPSGSVFLWNGEVFGGLPIDESMNDGERLFQELESRAIGDSVSEVLKVIEGPYAFIYYDAARYQLWFGRDPLGRRSLMLAKPDMVDDTIIIASHFNGQELWPTSEVMAESLFLVELSTCLHPFKILAVERQIPKPVLNQSIPQDLDRVTTSDLVDGGLPPALLYARSALKQCLGDAVRRRVMDISQRYQYDDTDPSVAILFSGGLDCTTLALLAHQHLPPNQSIDLINVAFENPRSLSNISQRTDTEGAPDVFAVPDRKTGESSWAELCSLAPDRIWRFVKVDVSISEYHTHRHQIIQLMKPNFTVMDLSIAAALYFASRGIGSYLIRPSCDQVPSYIQAYRSPARVVLSGLGADELLGGYSRHRAAYSTPETPNWTGLIDELQLDLDRISTRNLGRDDRIIAQHAREVRYPFLDSTVVRTLAAMAVHLKCDPDLGRGIGDKLVLRCLAQSLGLYHAGKLEKRAIQFGARSAKLEGVAKGTVELVKEEPSSSTMKSLTDFKVIQNKRPRLTRKQFQNLVTRLFRTPEDIATGMFPPDLVLSTLPFLSTPVNETVILAYPCQLEAARKLSSIACAAPSPVTPIYRVAPIPSKGMGLLAARTVKVGELIIAERPISIMPERLESLHQRTLDQVHFAVFDLMPFENQLQLSALSSTEVDVHPIVSKIWNNEISLGLCDTTGSQSSSYAYSAVYPTISRCNHDCTPNSRWHFDLDSFSLNLCAVRNIEAGEQITVSYIQHLVPRVDRLGKLKEKWGFDCDCHACCLDSPELRAASDARRCSLAVDEAFFNRLLSVVLPPSGVIDEDGEEETRNRFHSLLEDIGTSVEELILRGHAALARLKEEGLTEERATVMGAMAIICYYGLDDLDRAGAFAAECVDVVRAVKGFGSVEASELELYLETVEQS